MKKTIFKGFKVFDGIKFIEADSVLVENGIISK